MGAAAGTVVTRVLALDHDKGENGRLSYSIVEGESLCVCMGWERERDAVKSCIFLHL